MAGCDEYRRREFGPPVTVAMPLSGIAVALHQAFSDANAKASAEFDYLLGRLDLLTRYHH